MNQLKIENLIEKFCQAANHYMATLDGDWRTANREVATIRKTIKALRSFGDNGRDAILAQTDNPDLSVASMAAAYSLKNSSKKSISVLTRIAKEPGLIGFAAEQALLRWEEGNWHLDE
jgi:carbamate kinase